jgi:hypothetical protein
MQSAARGDLPDADGLVAAARGHHLAARADREAAEPPVTGGEPLQLLTGSGIPEADRIIL